MNWPGLPWLLADASGWLDMAVFLLPLIVSAVAVLLSLTVGGYLERRHLKHIEVRRAAFAAFSPTNVRRMPGAAPGGTLVTGEAVISAGHLKSLFAQIKKFFGGELRSYHIIMFRAREEAQLRMLAAAREQGFDGVCNIRVETVDLAASTTSRQRTGTYAAIIVSGTAYRRLVEDHG